MCPLQQSLWCTGYGAERKRAQAGVQDGVCVHAQADLNTSIPQRAGPQEATPFTLCINGHSRQRVAMQNPGGLHTASV